MYAESLKTVMQSFFTYDIVVRENIYIQWNLPKVDTYGLKILSALERCPPWKGFAHFDKKKVENSVLQSREPIRLVHIPLLPSPVK